MRKVGHGESSVRHPQPDERISLSQTYAEEARHRTTASFIDSAQADQRLAENHTKHPASKAERLDTATSDTYLPSILPE